MATSEQHEADRASEEARGLDQHDLALLAFESRWWPQPAAKEQAIRAEFGISAARYYQLLGALLDSPLALAHDPMLVNRLLRMRDARSQARSRRTIRTIE